MYSLRHPVHRRLKKNYQYKTYVDHVPPCTLTYNKNIVEGNSDFNNIAQILQLALPCFTRIFKTIPEEKKSQMKEDKKTNPI